jgi:hypothetical protein
MAAARFLIEHTALCRWNGCPDGRFRLRFVPDRPVDSLRRVLPPPEINTFNSMIGPSGRKHTLLAIFQPATAKLPRRQSDSLDFV